MSLSIALLHQKPEFLKECCDLLNEEWKRSETARMRSFQNSCDTLPVNIILLENNHLIGHLKLSVIPSMPEACFVESVVIQKQLRGKGYGTKIMNMAEEHCKNFLKLERVVISTRGQEMFYKKLGYEECPPISIYGFPSNILCNLDVCKNADSYKKNEIINRPGAKTYMVKVL